MGLLLGVAVNAQAGNNAGGNFSTWPDTGQTKCYNEAVEIPCPPEGEPFHGQDAQYQGPVRSYTSLGGGTMVQDNVTGLIWEVKQNRDNTKDYTNPHDADNTYTWCDTNSATNGGDAGTCGANDTEGYIDTLNSAGFGGYSDWRIPTLKELVTLEDYSAYYPTINTALFPNTVSSHYWSSTTDAQYSGNAWRVHFYNGDNFINNKSDSLYVRAVRGGQ